MQPQHTFDRPLCSLELNIVKDMERKGVFFWRLAATVFPRLKQIE